MRFSDAFGVALADANAAHAARVTGKPLSPVTGFAQLDTELDGRSAAGVRSINGDPGAGKIAFALQVTATCQFPALFVTAEMAPAEFLRQQTRVTGTFLGKFKSGELALDEVRQLFMRGPAPRHT